MHAYAYAYVRLEVGVEMEGAANILFDLVGVGRARSEALQRLVALQPRPLAVHARNVERRVPHLHVRARVYARVYVRECM